MQNMSDRIMEAKLEVIRQGMKDLLYIVRPMDIDAETWDKLCYPYLDGAAQAIYNGFNQVDIDFEDKWFQFKEQSRA